MTNGIDTTMESMQPASPNSAKHGVVAQAGFPKLLDRYHAMLTSGHLRDSLIRPVTLFGYAPIKVTGP